MRPIDTPKLLGGGECDGVVRIPQFLSASEVAAVHTGLHRSIRDDLASKPLNARTFEAERHHQPHGRSGL